MLLTGAKKIAVNFREKYSGLPVIFAAQTSLSLCYSVRFTLQAVISSLRNKIKQGDPQY